MMKASLILVVLLGCGGDDGGGGGGGIFDPGPDGGTGSNNGTDGSELLGAWAYTACTSGAKYEAIVADQRFHWKREYFTQTGSACTTPYAIERFVDTYTVRGESPLAPGARKIDYVTEAATLTITTTTGAMQANNNAYCGYTDWQVNVAKDVTGDSCTNTDGSILKFEPAGYHFYDIYKVDTNKLYFGDTATGPGTSDATRPTALLTGYYTKQ